MPTLGGIVEHGESAKGNTAFGFEIPINNDSTVANINVISLVPDETFLPDQANASSQTLRDFTEGQDWFLKRVVGKCWVAASQGPAAVNQITSWAHVAVACALFVARAQDDNAELPDLTVDEYDPWNSQNVRQPWIWRRSWVLSDNEVTNTGNTHYPWDFMNSNLIVSSSLDGPHIDAKTARRIRREERLWFVASCVPFTNFLDDGGAVSNSTLKVSVNLDYRILGAMRKSNNRSTF